jgi:hypothetical protein
MKNVIIGLAMVAATLAACNSNSNKSSESQNRSKDTQVISQTDNTTVTTLSDTDAQNAVSIKEIVNQYLQIKNALSNDNGKDAAIAGNAFVELMGKMDKISLATDKKKIWDDISDDAKEMAEHIGENADKLEHQREHFEMLSKDIYDLVKAFGSDQVLYKVFDSMYNNGKGAFWLSETKEIKNPYMGKAMSNSGSIQEEIK